MNFFTEHLRDSLEHWTFSFEFFSLSWYLILSSLSKVQMMNWYMYDIVFKFELLKFTNALLPEIWYINIA